MTDHLTPVQRSRNMRLIRSKDTTPELLVRKALFEKGFRYRVSYDKLPGKPDLVFVSLKRTIFIHGCFWHRHGCKRSTFPKSNRKYWRSKFKKNIIRDKKIQAQLEDLSWKYLVIWECEINENLQEALGKVLRFLKF
ncbi:DNA mismatch endonuclease Vsr [Candidatus Marinimicrobia bacterium MT.SAG.3]|nr:DNA mismatch endonuclease Vsr [Candidatus Marinimicrobia bacterium MT.SAG.3]